MPNSVSHQTPALYLKMKFPARIDEVAICMGTIVPDFTLLFIGLRNISHSLLGLLYWTIPLTIIMTLLFRKFFASYIADFAYKGGFIPKILRYFGANDWHLLKDKKYNRKAIFIMIYSAFIGGLTHLFLDLPSHPTIELFFPWVIFQNIDFLLIPFLDLGTISIEVWRIEGVILISDVIWVIEDIIFLSTSLMLLRYVNKKDLIKQWSDNP